MVREERPKEMSEYPRLQTVRCAICDAQITLIIELVIRTPLVREGMNPLAFDPEPTVLDGCHHFYDREKENR
jgi:hypothetical protein